MKWILLLGLFLFTACDDWQKALEEINAIKETDRALERIAALDAALAGKKDDPESLHRRAELLVRCKVPRVPLLAKGTTALQAIGLLEKVLEVQPERVDSRYLLARTCLGLPGFFGQHDRGIRALKTLVTAAERRPGSVPYPDVFLRLAKLEPADAERVLRIGRRSFPERDDMVVPERPDPSGAKARFVKALEENRLDYGALDGALAAAEEEDPKDPEVPLFRGLLRLWRLERTADGRAASEAIALFRKARALNPNDTRIHGWLGPLLYITGKSVGNESMQEEGEREMDRGVEVNPEQNLFGRALAFRRAGEKPAQVEEDLYRTLEICAGQKLDRTRFRPTGSTRAHPSCRNSKKAPHNRAGTLFWASEFFRAQGKKEKAIDAVRAALAADSTKKWPYRALARSRLDLLEGRREAMDRAPTSCALCHRVR